MKSYMPLIVSGMHRSGTSLIASYLSNIGISMGTNLLAPDGNNPKGYFEDVDFLEFQRKILRRASENGVPGWFDWGYSESETINNQIINSFKQEARNLLEEKITGQHWGWKDPRTTLLLDFWNDLIPGASYILIYRNPWEVKKSLEKINATVFNENPDYPYKIWNFYNKNLISFYKKNPDSCILVSAEGFLRNPSKLSDLVAAKLDIEVDSEKAKDLNVISPDLFNVNDHDLEDLEYFDGWDETKEILQTLHDLADIPGDKYIKELNNDKPAISIVIPCYNQGKYLQNAVFSVEKSLNNHYELIIVNDGSDDQETIDILYKLENSGFRVIHQHNKGLAEARNAGIGEAAAPYILPLDADNMIEPAFMTKAVKILERQPDVGVVYSNRRDFGDHFQYMEFPDFDAQRLLSVNYIDACAVFRKEIWKSNGGYDPDMPVMGYEDWEFWIKTYKAGWKFQHDEEFGFYYRNSKDSMISNSNLPENRQKLVEYIVNKHRDLYAGHVKSVVSYLTRNLSDIENNYFKIIQENEYFKQIQSKIKELELQLYHMETSKFWKLKIAFDKIRLFLTSDSYAPKKRFKLLQRIRFLISPIGYKILSKLFRKALRIFLLTAFPKRFNRLRVKNAYGQWLSRTLPKEIDLLKFQIQAKSFKYKPRISIILPVYNPPLDFFTDTIASVKGQIYANWELCIADDHSTDQKLVEQLRSYVRSDERIKCVFRDQNGHISACSNSALELATGDFALFLDHDDLLTRDALYHVVAALNEDPEIDILYSDEDKIDENDEHSKPHFKPDYCPDNLLSRNYFGHVVVSRLSLVRSAGGFRLGFEGSQDYDLILRLTEKTSNIHHIPRILYHWRIHKKSAARSEKVKPYAYEAAKKALNEALERRNEKGKVDFLDNFTGYNVRYLIRMVEPVTIIIPTKDKSNILKSCLQSVFEKTTYPDYRVLVVDNGSTEKELFELLDYYKNRYPSKFEYYTNNIDFNFSTLMNDAVARVDSGYLLFLNNDTEIISPDWIEAMVEQAQRKSIGVVGVKLLYPNETIQHAGVIIGLGDAAGHTFVGYQKNSPGYFNYINTINNYSAVTAACMMCRKAVFDEAGGFDESFSVEYNDIDFCLKLKEKGYNNIYLPHVNLYHYESYSRGNPFLNRKSYKRHLKELSLFRHKWIRYIEDDPCFNPNLSKCHDDFQLFD